MLLAGVLHAQFQILPDIEVKGESQIKIFLYKKALPYSRESIMEDSIMAFVPSSLPVLDWAQKDLPTPGFRQYLHMQGDTSWGLDADLKYYPDTRTLSKAQAMLSMKFPKSQMHSHHLHLGLDFTMPEDQAVDFSVRHYNSGMKSLDSEYTQASLASYHDRLYFKDLSIRQMSNEIRGYRFEQDNGGTAFSSNGLGFTHHSLLDFADFTWGNRLYLYSKKPILHSFVELQQDVIDRFSIHVIHDGYSFFPVPGFYFRYVTDYDQELSIVNQPETQRNDFSELLDAFRWLSFDPSRKNTTIPLNLRIALDDTYPSENSFFLHRYLFSNSTKYKLNAPILRDSPNPGVPQLYFSDIFTNESGVSLSFERGGMSFEQAILLYLSYLPDENWIREPYSALLKVESSLAYQRFPFEASLNLKQHYFALDHHQNHLPELIDLSVYASYDLNLQSQIYLKVENLLNFPKWQLKSLPRQDTSLYAGFVQRF